jgi:hypothetical protein
MTAGGCEKATALQLVSGRAQGVRARWCTPKETARIRAVPAENRVPGHGGILFRPKIARKPAADRAAGMLWHQTPGNPESHQAGSPAENSGLGAVCTGIRGRRCRVRFPARK